MRGMGGGWVGGWVGEGVQGGVRGAVEDANMFAARAWLTLRSDGGVRVSS